MNEVSHAPNPEGMRDDPPYTLALVSVGCFGKMWQLHRRTCIGSLSPLRCPPGTLPGPSLPAGLAPGTKRWCRCSRLADLQMSLGPELAGLQSVPAPGWRWHGTGGRNDQESFN